MCISTYFLKLTQLQLHSYKSQIFKAGINKVPLRLDDTSPRCTYPAKDTTENAMLQKSMLPNVKCKFKCNILIYSQKPDLLTYFEKGGRVSCKGTVLSKL